MTTTIKINKYLCLINYTDDLLRCKFHFLGKQRRQTFKLFLAIQKQRRREAQGPSQQRSCALFCFLCRVPWIQNAEQGKDHHPKSDAQDSPPASWWCRTWEEERRWTKLKKEKEKKNTYSEMGLPVCRHLQRIVHLEHGTPLTCVIWYQVSPFCNLWVVQSWFMWFIAALLSDKEEQARRDTQRPGCEKHQDNMPGEPWKQNAGSFLFIFRKDFDQNVKHVKHMSAFCFTLWSQLGPAVGRPQGHGCTGLAWGLCKLGCPGGSSSWQILWIYTTVLARSSQDEVSSQCLPSPGRLQSMCSSC